MHPLLIPLLSVLPLLAPAHTPNSSWPHGPFISSGRQILNALNETVVYAGVNWPGAADVMIPEGLQYASIASIVSKIKALGMNVIRLTYATEMIDDVFGNDGRDVLLRDALVTALGGANASFVFGEIMRVNPQLGEDVTRLQVSSFCLVLGRLCQGCLLKRTSPRSLGFRLQPCWISSVLLAACRISPYFSFWDLSFFCDFRLPGFIRA